jgi:hypothetical protein
MIASMFPGAQGSECLHAWNTIQQSGLGRQRAKWTSADDSELNRLVELLGTGKWQEIAQRLNSGNRSRMPRTARQCRYRWLNHANPELKTYEQAVNGRTRATLAEIVGLCEAWLSLGHKWGEIAQILGRSQAWVKEAWKRVLKAEDVSLLSCTRLELRQRIMNITHKLRLIGAGLPHDQTYNDYLLLNQLMVHRGKQPAQLPPFSARHESDKLPCKAEVNETCLTIPNSHSRYDSVLFPSKLPQHDSDPQLPSPSTLVEQGKCPDFFDNPFPLEGWAGDWDRTTTHVLQSLH